MPGMDLNADQCYRALRARDARFDGRFFIGVKTTGVYCRPVCPARTPLRRNIAFYPCASAAEAAGFRPCLRCRPETSPGTPAWLGSSATVSRALRLIHEGALDEGGVDELAARLGVGPRHLSRLFDEHLGISPVAIAQTRRVHFAKRLLDDSAMPITDIAFAAGFQSVRRFNAAFKAKYGRAPSAIRRKKVAADSGFTLRLSYRPPYDWDSIIGFLAGRAIPGVEVVDGESYRRTVLFDDTAAVIEVRRVEGSNGLQVSGPASIAVHGLQIVERVRQLFDLTADPAAIALHLSQDALLRLSLEASPGLRVPGAWDGFEIGVRAILGQQVSVAAATTISGRLAARYGEPLADGGPGLTHLFPRPERLAHARLTGIGLTKKRAAAVSTFARAVCEDASLVRGNGGLERTVEQLTALPGIGLWTAHYIGMRALREPDAFPAGDMVLQRAASNNGRRLTEKALTERAEDWRPWRAYAALHLWRTYAEQTNRQSGG
jgi:AraC family transcriptional regulator, regulatory protein of adaptative response / DNA-3-methyladenine glycosylase II